MNVFLARQPIFDRHKKLFGYELLFRSGIGNAFPGIDGDVATTNLISNLFFPFEVIQVLGHKKGLINFTEKLILNKAPLFLPKDLFIIEVLEDVSPTEDIISNLKLFKDRGYRIALDDFVYHENFEPMIGLSHIIKFDLRQTSIASLYSIIEDLKDRHNIKFLAEKVETYDEYTLAREVGCHYFQGYFFARPEMISSKGLSTNQVTKLKLVDELGKSDIDIKKLESYIRNDVPLSFKLLKYANSAYFNRKIPIDTIKDAVAYIGEQELRNFVNVVVLTDLGTGKPNELIRLSITRAKLCEKLSRSITSKFTEDELFTLGLFSLMDALMDCRMDDVLDHLSFSDKMRKALLGEDAEFEKILDIITALEMGDWESTVFKKMKGSELEQQLPVLYSESINMANAFYQ